MAQPQVIFGSGNVHITLLKDANGNSVLSTPLRISNVQNISADLGKAENKLFYGQKEFAIYAEQNKKITEVSFEIGEIHAQMLNQIYFGQSVTDGSNVMFCDYDGIVLPSAVDSATYIEYLIKPKEGSFIVDKGVINVDAMPLTKVALPIDLADLNLAIDEYAVNVNTGTYYFNTNLENDKVYIDYIHSSTFGASLVINNKLMGSTPIVSIDLSGKAEGNKWLIQYPKAIPKQFGFATKLDDYGLYKVSYDVVADRASGVVGKIFLRS